MSPKASIVISVYNNLWFLSLVLAGLETQTERDFEVIISDDGSGDAFVDGLRALQQASPLKIRHNWHPDNGFRKNKILNRSIAMAAGPYIIFLDGDCIPHPAFVAEHLAAGAPGRCLSGRRVDLSPELTAALSPERIRRGLLSSSGFIVKMLRDYLLGRLRHVKSGIYITNAWLRARFNAKPRGLLGANFSLHKADLLAVNGFDERYTEPTFGEDSDLELRLRLNGVSFRPMISMAVCFHCHHKLLPRPDGSRLLYEQAIIENRAFTPYGIVQRDR